MKILAIFLPLIMGIISIIFKRFIGNKGSVILNIIGIIIVLLLNIFLMIKNILKEGRIIKVNLIEWLNLIEMEINIEIILDNLSIIMMLLISVVSFLVMVYSVDYMYSDNRIGEFYSYLAFFTFFMILYISAGNLIQGFLGWEGVGIMSYILINFWYNRIEANKAAMKAIILNRVGDIFFLLGIGLIFIECKTINYYEIYGIIERKKKSINLSIFKNNLIIDYNIIDIILICFIIAMMSKSAQIILHTWLPDAMEGPTPVSALLHAATMVTAGIYLIIRMSYIVEMSSIGLKIFIILLGAITALFGGIVASFQFDIKKVIAYSTCSQLGYMVYGCGISSYDMSMFHLVNHGFFKALLFLSAGVIIHGMQGEQDIRKMGGLIKIYPFTYRMMMIGVFALMGLPFMSGFYSKELIIKMGRSVCNNIYDINDIYKYIIFSYYILMCSIIMTGYYNIRMINLTYLGIIRNTKRIIINGGENSNYLGIPLIMLCILSIFSGYILEDIMVGWGTNYWNNSLYLLDNYYKGINFTNMNYIKILSKLNVTIIPLINLIIGIFIYMVSKIIYEKYIKQIKNNLKILNIIEIIYMYFNKGMMFDKIYNNYIVKPILYINNKIYKNIEQGIFELIGLVGIKILILNISKEISKGKSGYISDYIYINIIILLLGLIILKLYILKIVLYIIILIIIQLNNKKRND